jgi:hypothetical protein
MKTIALITATLAAGCGVDTRPSTSVTAPLDAVALTTHRLGGASLSEMHLLATPDGRDAMSHVVSCGLPAGASITAIAGDGTPYSFAGRIGLAPGWLHHTPTPGERRRVIACLGAAGTGSIRT